MNNILDILYKSCLAFFEFVIDIMIVLLSVYFIYIFFGYNIITNIISLIICISGFTYGFNDMINCYKENKNNN